jgi:hypothetical protein
MLKRADLEEHAIRTQIETAMTANVLIDSSLEGNLLSKQPLGRAMTANVLIDSSLEGLKVLIE